jgi:hypothetical protein
LDTFTNPGPSTWEDDPGFEHDVVHSNSYDALEALEAKVGIDSSAVTTSLDYIIKNTTGGHSHNGANSKLTAHEGVATAAHAATAVSIADAGGNYTGTNVETALTEIDARLDPLETYKTAEVAKWVVKTADQTKTTTAPASLSSSDADNTLKFTMTANTKYRFRAVIFYDTGATEDFKWRHNGPASPTLVVIRRQSILPAGTTYNAIAIDAAYSAADVVMAGTSAGAGFIEFDGIIFNGANAGDFLFEWSQNTSGGVATIVRAGSYIYYSNV